MFFGHYVGQKLMNASSSEMYLPKYFNCIDLPLAERSGISQSCYAFVLRILFWKHCWQFLNKKATLDVAKKWMSVYSINQTSTCVHRLLTCLFMNKFVSCYPKFRIVLLQQVLFSISYK